MLLRVSALERMDLKDLLVKQADYLLNQNQNFNEFSLFIKLMHQLYFHFFSIVK